MAGIDNAATELVDEGENGFVARSDSPRISPRRSCACATRGPQLRARTADWFARNAERLSLDRSLDRVAAAYAADRDNAAR